MTHEAGIGVAPVTLSIHIQGEERDLGTRVILYRPFSLDSYLVYVSTNYIRINSHMSRIQQMRKHMARGSRAPKISLESI